MPRRIKKNIPKSLIVKKKTTKKKYKRLPPKTTSELKIIINGKTFDAKKYVVVSSNETVDVFDIIGERIQKKELKWVFSDTKDLIYLHYYLIL